MRILKLLCKLYSIRSRMIRNNILRILLKLDGGEPFSELLRDIFKKYHGIDIGMYTIGGCFKPGNVAAGTTIGRYCSLARNIIILNRNHPMDFKSTHAFFYNPVLKLCDKYVIENSTLKVGNDVWIGEYAVILAHVTEIGDGAVIGAGAIVNKNVPPYSIVVGNPARVVRYRFSKDVIDELLASKWWEKDINELKPHLNEFQQPYEEFLLANGRKSAGVNDIDAENIDSA
jgi:virginiamycin A acetyltransferase